MLGNTTVLAKAAFAEWLATQIESGAPHAVVRFGDGERALLEARRDNAESMKAAIGKLANQTGTRLSSDAVLEIGETVWHAFDHADVLGILHRYEFVPERPNPLTSLYAERVASGRSPVALTDCRVHRGLLDTLRELLTGRPLSVISCRHVKPVLEGWGAVDIVVYRIPSAFVQRDIDGEYEAALHSVPIWPDFYGVRTASPSNASERGPYADYYDEELRELVRESCQAIIDRFGYRF